MNVLIFIVCVIVLIGVDVVVVLLGVIGVMSGLLYGGVLVCVLLMFDEVECVGDVCSVVKGILDCGEKLMGFGYWVYCVEDLWVWVLWVVVEWLGVFCYEVVVVVE